MTRRSMPSSFHVNLFALMPVRCSSSTCEAVMAETGADFGLHPFFMRAVTSAWESASRFSVEFWDPVSQTGLRGKVRPRILA